MKLYGELKQFKACTEEIINILENEEYDKLEDILNKRNIIIKNINNMNYSKEDFIKIASELDLLRLENKAYSILIEKRDVLKAKIQKFFLNKKANRMYNHNMYKSAKIFSKKI